MGGRRRRAPPGPPLAGVGHAQEARDDQHFGDAPERVGLQQHAPDPRIEREPREATADLRESAVRVHRPELAQQAQAVVDVAPVGGVDEREAVYVAQPQREHAQQHRREVRAPDLGLRVSGPRREVGLVIEPDAHSGAGPAAPSGALFGRGPRDRLHRQPLHPGAVGVPAHPGRPRVDDEADPRHRERRLRDVGREYHTAAGGGCEQRLLVRRGHPGVEGKELGIREPETSEPDFGLADLALPGQEHQHVAGLVADLLQRSRDLVRDILSLVPGAVPDLDRVGPALHLDHRRPVEERAQLLDLQGGRGHDDPQVRAPPHELAEVAEDEVDVEGPLVRLVDDQGVVGEQVAVALDLREQDAVGHHLDQGVRRGVPAEADMAAHEPPELRAGLRREPRRNAARRDPSRLGMADHRADPAARPEADLRKLGALPRSGRAHHQGDRMAGDGAGDRLRLPGDRQVRGHLRLRRRRGPRGAAGGRRLDRRGQLRPLPGIRAPGEQRLAAAAQARGVGEHAGVEPRIERLRGDGARRLIHRGPASACSLFPWTGEYLVRSVGRLRRRPVSTAARGRTGCRRSSAP